MKSDVRETIQEYLIYILVFSVAILLIAILLALPVYFLYPIVVRAVFPGLVISGMLAEKLTLFQSFCLMLFTSILFKGSTNKAYTKN